MSAVTITGIAAGGDGVGRLDDGRAVFVPRTAPGDVVELRQVALHRRYARARIARLLESGPGRIEPRCRHYTSDDCGGCQLQHLSAGAQRDVKRTIVREALSRIGGLQVEVPPLVPGSADWAYRNRITLTVDPGSGRAGFHPLGTSDRVFPLQRCEIAAPALNQEWARVRAAGLPPGTERVTLRLDDAGGAQVVFHPKHEPPPFAQVQTGLGDRIRREAVTSLEPGPGLHAWDLYAGAGAGSDLLAEAGATVESVEQHPEGVAAGTARPGVTRHVGDVGAWLPRLGSPDLVLVNPPRTGLGQGVAEAVGRRGPSRIAYVSCDPATLARDIKALAGYRVGLIRAYDLFPQTAHVETLVTLERRPA